MASHFDRFALQIRPLAYAICNLKSSLFTVEGYYEALSTYVHEMCHSFGGDSSASFSQALTYAIKSLMVNKEIVANGRCKWNQEFEKKFGT